MMEVATLESPNRDLDISIPSEISGYCSYEKGHHLLKNRYMYQAHIQKGSFGKVTLAIDVLTNRKVAMKAMHKTKEVEAMARHEIRVLQKLGHGNEHICQLLDSFDTEDFVVLVLEYCANGDLFDMIHSGASTPSAVDVWNLAKEMYSGLNYSHSLGIYHRDLKPENILITDKGRVKICDWGLATFTRHSTVFNVGTEKYMAPECFLHTPISSNPNVVVESYDCKLADYWSYAITLLTAIFGTCPFQPVSANCGETWGSADDFKLKNKGVKKSLESDYNFKNFVFYNKPEILFDIYPDMNRNCYEIFMNLLRVGGTEDDLESYTRKNQLRDLDKFIEDLEAKWKYGLTVWDEEEIQDNDFDFDESFLHGHGVHQDSVFDMDDFAGEDKHGESKAPPPKSNDFAELALDAGVPESPSVPVSHGSSIPVPSLVESSYQPKSWYDFEEDLDDAEFNKLFNSLSFRSEAPIASKAAKSGQLDKHMIRIVEKEIPMEGVPVGEPRLGWDDY